MLFLQTERTSPDFLPFSPCCNLHTRHAPTIAESTSTDRSWDLASLLHWRVGLRPAFVNALHNNEDEAPHQFATLLHGENPFLNNLVARAVRILLSAVLPSTTNLVPLEDLSIMWDMQDTTWLQQVNTPFRFEIVNDSHCTFYVFNEVPSSGWAHVWHIAVERALVALEVLRHGQNIGSTNELISHLYFLGVRFSVRVVHHSTRHSGHIAISVPRY